MQRKTNGWLSMHLPLQPPLLALSSSNVRLSAMRLMPCKSRWILPSKNLSHRQKNYFPRKGHRMFRVVPFVTTCSISTVNEKALRRFDITEESSFAKNVVFQLLFNGAGDEKDDPMDLEKAEEMKSLYDTSEGLSLLWWKHEIGVFAVRHLGFARNTFSNMIPDYVSKCCLYCSSFCQWMIVSHIFIYSQ
jgi:hypothetical protein